MKLSRIILAVSGLLIFVLPFQADAQTLKDGKLYLNEDGSHFVKLTLVSQIWLRNQEYNPGTTIFGYPKSSGTDIGIRRFRMQFFGQLTDRVFIYSQLGENNFNNISDRKLGFFVHDAMGEYAVIKKSLSLGGGLSAWSGLARFASPSVGSIMGVDAPLFEQSTNDVTDQFLRKLSVYAKGKIGKFDYRLVMAQPMAFQKGTGYSATLSSTSNFSSLPPKMQWNGYFMYQFLDQESNQTPYMTGTYLGKKKVFNIGAGFVYQPDAMWHQGLTPSDTVQTNMVQLAADVYYDAPVGANGEAVSLYGSATHFDFGPDYTRNLGVMNPANGTNNKNILNGGGNGFPAYGTGNVLYVQAGYKLKDNLIGKTTLMPYAALQHANYEKLNSPMNFVDLGIGWLLSGHTSKLTASYQSRPVYLANGDLSERKNAFVLQYQAFFN